jgi:hypothetical protein
MMLLWTNDPLISWGQSGVTPTIGSSTRSPDLVNRVIGQPTTGAGYKRRAREAGGSHRDTQRPEVQVDCRGEVRETFRALR